MSNIEYNGEIVPIFVALGHIIHWHILSDDATTKSLSTSIVVIPEGGSADISCRSVGAPVPSITWEFNNETTDFEQTDTETPFVATLTGTIGNRGFDLTPGSIESSLHIVSATYPDHDGVYTCIGTNSDDLTVASSSAFITVQVNGELHHCIISTIHESIDPVIPAVEINSNDTLVGIGNDVIITCFVPRGNPSNHMYTITNTDTGSTTTGQTRILTDIQMIDVGTYRCDVTNDAGTGTSNTVTIELGGMTSNFRPNCTHISQPCRPPCCDHHSAGPCDTEHHYRPCVCCNWRHSYRNCLGAV